MLHSYRVVPLFMQEPAACTQAASDLTNPGALTLPCVHCKPPFVTSDHLFSHLSTVSPVQPNSIARVQMLLSSPDVLIIIPSSRFTFPSSSCPKKHSSAALPISDRDRVCVCFSSVTGSSCCCDLLNDLHHFLNLRRSGKNARNKWHSDVGRARSDARPAAKMGCRVEILPEKYSRITKDTLVLQQRNIEADLQNQKGV